MSVHLDLLESVLDLIEASRFPKRRSPIGKKSTKGSEKGYMHNYERKNDASHNPFSNASSIGPGPRGRSRSETGIWDCRKIGKYRQRCTHKETGRKITVRVKEGWKKDYNREYRERGFPRTVGGKQLVSPKRAERLDAPPEERKEPEGRKPHGKRKSKEARRQKARHLKQKMQNVPAGGKKTSRKRGGGRKRKQLATGTQGSLPMESVSVHEQLLQERKGQPAYWMKGLKLERGALKRRYGLKPHQTIPAEVWEQIEADKDRLMKKSAKGKLTRNEKRHLKQIVLGMTFRRIARSQQESGHEAVQLDHLQLNEDTIRLLNVLREVLS